MQGTEIPIVELALGGSRAEHTGAFRENVLILSHEKDVPPSQGVLEITKKYLKQNSALKVDGQDCWSGWNAFYSRITDTGSWALTSISGEGGEAALADVDRFMEIGFVQDEDGIHLGSSAFNCVEALRVRLSPGQWRDLARQLSEKEEDCEKSLERIRGMGVQMRGELSESKVVDYSRFQTFSKCIGKLRRKQEYNRRFLRTVKLHMMETP